MLLSCSNIRNTEPATLHMLFVQVVRACACPHYRHNVRSIRGHSLASVTKLPEPIVSWNCHSQNLWTWHFWFCDFRIRHFCLLVHNGCNWCVALRTCLLLLYHCTSVESVRFCVHILSLYCVSTHACCYTPYSVHMSPESTHRLMGVYMEVLISGIILQYKVSTSFSCFL